MKYSKLIFLLILFPSCREKYCVEDKGIKYVFFKNVNNVENSIPQEAIDGETYLSLFFLESLTGISSSVNYGDVSFYKNQEDINRDSNHWKKWYEKNKCRLKKQELDSLQDKIKSSNPWINIDR